LALSLQLACHSVAIAIDIATVGCCIATTTTTVLLSSCFYNESVLKGVVCKALAKLQPKEDQ
jgi:hypothetical protein